MNKKKEKYVIVSVRKQKTPIATTGKLLMIHSTNFFGLVVLQSYCL